MSGNEKCTLEPSGIPEPGRRNICDTLQDKFSNYIFLLQEVHFRRLAHFRYVIYQESSITLPQPISIGTQIGYINGFGALSRKA